MINFWNGDDMKMVYHYMYFNALSFTCFVDMTVDFYL